MDFQNLRYSPAVYRAALGCLFFNQGIIFASWASRIADVKTNLNLNEADRTGLRDGAFRIPRHALRQQNDGARRRNILSRNARRPVSRRNADRAICNAHVLRSCGEPEQYIHKHAGGRGRVRLRALHYVVLPRAMEPRGILRRDFERDARGKQRGAIPKLRGGFCFQRRGNARRAEFYPSGGHKAGARPRRRAQKAHDFFAYSVYNNARRHRIRLHELRGHDVRLERRLLQGSNRRG